MSLPFSEVFREKSSIAALLHPTAPPISVRISERSSSDRFHQIVRRRTLGRDVDCEQGRRLGRARIARDSMYRTRRLPPGIAGMEGLLGSVADLRDDGTRNDECHDAIGVK